MNALYLLREYPALEKAIELKRLELTVPYIETDTNIGGGSAGMVDMSVQDTAIGLAEDEELLELVLIKDLIEDTMKEFSLHDEFIFNDYIKTLDSGLKDIRRYMSHVRAMNKECD